MKEKLKLETIHSDDCEMVVYSIDYRYMVDIQVDDVYGFEDINLTKSLDQPQLKALITHLQKQVICE